MIKEGQIYKDSNNKGYLIYGLAEEERTGASLVIFKAFEGRTWNVKRENEFIIDYKLVK